MGGKQTFEVVLKKHEKMEDTGIEIPFDVEAVFGAKRVPVKALVNEVEYRGSIVRMGGTYVLGIPKSFREAAGISAGELIVVTIELDAEERNVTIPADLAAALSAKGVADIFAALSYTYRKEHVRAVEDAKSYKTREKRIAKAVEMAASKKSKQDVGS